MAEAAPRRVRTGLVIGKFMPPHAGHQFLVDAAAAQCDRLALMLFSKASEPIPGDLRASWLRELFPRAEVVHVRDEAAVDYASEAAWSSWTAIISRNLPAGIRPDVVFSSEPYGPELARRLVAQHVAIDPERTHVPVSASAVRAQPWAHWQYIPAPVRPYFLKRVVILGAESTWKTTLAARLAAHFRTAWAPEYAREYLDGRSAPLTTADMPVIAGGQVALEERGAASAAGVLICDTNLLATQLWFERYWGGPAPDIAALHAGRHYDLALLSAVEGTPWVDDGLRDSPHLRRWFEARYLEELAREGLPVVTLRGSFDARLDAAVTAVSGLLR